MKQWLPLFVLLLLVHLHGFAQLKLTVLDAVTKQPISGANILNPVSNQVETTNAAGIVQLRNQPPLLVLSHMGYETDTLQAPYPEIYLLFPSEKILNEIVVSGYESPRVLLEASGAEAVLPYESLRAIDETSILPAVNSVPGVRMEQRALGSYRISIRGSSLRSPFDVRNVKVYWNEIPFTEPNGVTQLRVLDLLQMDRIELIKGPVGSAFGAGTGGAMKIYSRHQPDDRFTASLNSGMGSFGLKRLGVTATAPVEKAKHSLRISHQQADGYREQNEFKRTNAQLFSTFNPSARQTISYNFFYSDLFYGLPGGLTAEQRAENPRQARPGNAFVKGSVEQNASINIQYVLAGLSHQYLISPRFNNTTSLYTTFYDFENPFNLDYKRDKKSGLGGRSVFNHYWDIAWGELSLSWGGEYQRSTEVARNFGNRSGVPDTLRFDDEIISGQGLGFATLTWQLPGDWILEGGLSITRSGYDIYRLTDVALDTSFRENVTFNTEFSPRLGVVKKFSPGFTARASISRGFSPPTVPEIRTNEGSINTDLQAEEGVNYEIGFRGFTSNARLQYDLAYYFFQLDETITTYTGPGGVQLFRNAGSTRQQGVEALVVLSLLEKESGLFRQIDWRSSFTYQDFQYDTYESGGEDFSGNALPGSAPFLVINTFQTRLAAGFYLNLQHNFTDAIPLNDENTVYSKPYHLVQAKAGWNWQAGPVFLDLQFMVDNLLNQNYSLGNDLNPFGGRYFQPAPSRNYLIQVSLTY